jgi:hypothetical protein
LCLLQLDEQSQHMQDSEQFGGVFGQPVVGLNVAELGRRPAVTDDRPLAVLLTVSSVRKMQAPSGRRAGTG